ncbi:MAG: dTMP kinase [Elusimicrobia bacterium]|nr:dTMP kinase [Elusimicrobiota bacterium]
MKKKGIFIIFEGPDRSGKSTQAKLLVKWLKEKKYKIVLTREPGGTKLSENIRKILLDTHSNISSLSELLLYEAARAQHTSDIIMPALKKGKVVISDRFTLASIAYQGYGRQLPIKTVETLNKIATAGLKPDITIVLNIPDRVFNERERLVEKFLGADRIESASSNFRKRVNKAYKILSNKPGVIKINAVNSIEAIHAEIIKKIEHKFSH